jgi:NAD(P)-dependent dehydrogenase (short-subunit alcohol dehydrogenase family)
VSRPLAIVAGASGALGRGIVARLLADQRPVLALGRSHDRLAALGDHPRLERLPHDVRDDATPVREAVGERTVGAIVHAAGTTLAGSILDVDAATIRMAIDTKVVGLLQLVRGVLDQLGPDARVIAVGGNLGFDPSPAAATPGLGNAAQAAAVRQLNRALAPRGVTCHTVAPGPVATPRFDALVEAEAQRRQLDPATARASLLEASPLGRATTVEEVAWAVALLLDPEAAALAGSTLLLDTGRRTALP